MRLPSSEALISSHLIELTQVGAAPVHVIEDTELHNGILLFVQSASVPVTRVSSASARVNSATVLTKRSGASRQLEAIVHKDSDHATH